MMFPIEDKDASIETLTDELNRLEAENIKLRGLLAKGNDDCIYCGLPKVDMAKCAHGFPGCSRADDLMSVTNV